MFDIRAGAYITPFYLPNLSMAVRAINHSGQDPNHMFCKFPSDFALYSLGQWDDGTCEMTLTTPPKVIGLVSQIVEEYDINSIVPGEERDAANGQAEIGYETSILGSTESRDSEKHIRP